MAQTVTSHPSASRTPPRLHAPAGPSFAGAPTARTASWTARQILCRGYRPGLRKIPSQSARYDRFQLPFNYPTRWQILVNAGQPVLRFLQ